MKKRFLSVIVLSAALFSVQAQEGKGGISPEMLGQIKQSYQGTAADKALRNAIGNNDIRKLALNQENMQGMDTHFSIKVESKGHHRPEVVWPLLAVYGAECDACQDSCRIRFSVFRVLRSLSLLLGPVGEGKPLLARHHRHLQESPD